MVLFSKDIFYKSKKRVINVNSIQMIQILLIIHFKGGIFIDHFHSLRMIMMMTVISDWISQKWVNFSDF